MSTAAKQSTRTVRSLPRPGNSVELSGWASRRKRSSSHLNIADTIRYWIDSQDRIVRVNEEWQRFAEENDGSESLSGGCLGMSLWSFIGDATLSNIYRDMVNLARAGRPIRFAFRCDAPRFRRLFEMRILATAGDLVEFASTLKSEEEREAVPILDCRQARNSQFVRMCSWCQRIAVNDRWLPAEIAVERLGFMMAPTVPELTHGVCEACLSKMMNQVSELKNAS